ncbi:hypothetical protein CDIK_3205 [Cucumispora dikerogammari]|nr:hypothetical protein CDIK_3205 [Cucumispora dikerogammari]
MSISRKHFSLSFLLPSFTGSVLNMPTSHLNMNQESCHTFYERKLKENKKTLDYNISNVAPNTPSCAQTANSFSVEENLPLDLSFSPEVKKALQLSVHSQEIKTNENKLCCNTVYDIAKKDLNAVPLFDNNLSYQALKITSLKEDPERCDSKTNKCLYTATARSKKHSFDSMSFKNHLHLNEKTELFNTKKTITKPTNTRKRKLMETDDSLSFTKKSVFERENSVDSDSCFARQSKINNGLNMVSVLSTGDTDIFESSTKNEKKHRKPNYIFDSLSNTKVLEPNITHYCEDNVHKNNKTGNNENHTCEKISDLLVEDSTVDKHIRETIYVVSEAKCVEKNIEKKLIPLSIKTDPTVSVENCDLFFEMVYGLGTDVSDCSALGNGRGYINKRFFPKLKTFLDKQNSPTNEHFFMEINIINIPFFLDLDLPIAPEKCSFSKPVFTPKRGTFFKECSIIICIPKNKIIKIIKFMPSFLYTHDCDFFYKNYLRKIRQWSYSDTFVNIRQLYDKKTIQNAQSNEQEIDNIPRRIDVSKEKNYVQDILGILPDALKYITHNKLQNQKELIEIINKLKSFEIHLKEIKEVKHGNSFLKIGMKQIFSFYSEFLSDSCRLSCITCEKKEEVVLWKTYKTVLKNIRNLSYALVDIYNIYLCEDETECLFLSPW